MKQKPALEQAFPRTSQSLVTMGLLVVEPDEGKIIVVEVIRLCQQTEYQKEVTIQQHSQLSQRENTIGIGPIPRHQ